MEGVVRVQEENKQTTLWTTRLCTKVSFCVLGWHQQMYLIDLLSAKFDARQPL